MRRFPQFIGTMEHSDFLPSPPRSLALYGAVSPNGEGGRISQVPGKPLRTCPGLRPRWVVASGPARGGYPGSLLARRYCLPLCGWRRLPPHPPFRGSIPRPARSLSTLHVAGYPTPRKTRFRLVGQPCRSGLSLADFHVRFLFLQVSTWHPPHPGFSWRTHIWGSAATGAADPQTPGP